ncbi:excalibur calcium-binding domain-containing protein [Neisseria musculi]|uniref:Excalibur calcium-binding domain protein n=1 Tax=Neisseria musculi TaxID=1815583 RepID=A0A7H1MAT2_9NEIS|nr:cold shock domain-containing protein [Neisseria musculi]QNT58747.1 cold-shock DNA-binding domain protein [Neisseria musculi]
MRYHGTIMRWDYELGFGFIKEEQTKAEIFAHIGEFETENPPPRDGETVSFEIVSNQRGTEEAKNIEYLNRRQPAAAAAEPNENSPKNLNRWLAGMAAALVGIPLLGAAGYYGLDYWQTYRAGQTNNAVVVDEVAEKMLAERRAWKEAVEATEKRRSPKAAAQAAVTTAFTCDGREHCSQMKSYEEAEFFLNHCPNVKMDGDKDGIPCEEQFAAEISRESAKRAGEADKGLKWFDDHIGDQNRRKP